MMADVEQKSIDDHGDNSPRNKKNASLFGKISKTVEFFFAPRIRSDDDPIKIAVQQSARKSLSRTTSVTRSRTTNKSETATQQTRSPENRPKTPKYGKDESVVRVEEKVEDALYPSHLEQTPELHGLFPDPKMDVIESLHDDISFLTRNTLEMDRYVRLTMTALLKYLSRIPERPVLSMPDLVVYLNFYPCVFRTQYKLRVERLLNSNGLSLTMNVRFKFRPEDLLPYFTSFYHTHLGRENLKFGESEDVSDSREQSVHAHAGPDVSRSMVKMMKSVFSRSSHHHSTTTSSSVSGSLQVEDGAVSDLRQIRMKRETLASVK